MAAFKTYSGDQLLQTVDMVEFPVTLNEDAVQTVPPGPVSRSDSSAPATAQEYDATLAAQTRQWRTNYEGIHTEAKKVFGALSGVSPAQFAAAAADDGSASSSTAASDSAGDTDITEWLTPPVGISAAADSQFLTVQPFRVTRTYTLPLQSIYYQARFQSVYPKAVVAQNVDGRGLCSFLPQTFSFAMQPAVTTYANVNAQVQTYRILEKSDEVYSHEVIAHQLITSVPTIVPAPPASPAIGTETVSFCNGVYLVNPGRWACGPDTGFCNGFNEDYAVSSLRGFNEQIVSNFIWDSATAPRLTLDGWVPVADNDKTTVSSSQTYEKIVTWSVQGALNGSYGDKGPNVRRERGGQLRPAGEMGLDAGHQHELVCLANDIARTGRPRVSGQKHF